MIFEIVKFGKFLEFSKLQIIENFLKCSNWKINKFLDFINLENQNLAERICNFRIVSPFDSIDKFYANLLVYWYYQFSKFLFPILVTCDS